MKRLSLVLAGLLLLAASCSDSDPSSSTTTAGGATTSTTAAMTDGDFPVTISTPAGDVTIDERPEAIVSLSATATESLFAIGAGDQVIAVDDQSNHPPEAPTTELSAYEPNLEAIASYDPDLVIISDDIDDLAAALDELGIPVLMQEVAVNLDDVYRQIDELGRATGHAGPATALAGQMETDITELLGSVPERDGPLTYYHELDRELYSVTSTTFIGEIYSLAGLDNIADAADTDGLGYPKLSAEYILEQDPDLIFLADTKCCGETAETLAGRAGWGGLSAVEGGNVHELDDDVASRWGPRVVDLLEIIVAATKNV